jgi:hypothetical protein
MDGFIDGPYVVGEKIAYGYDIYTVTLSRIDATPSGWHVNCLSLIFYIMFQRLIRNNSY